MAGRTRAESRARYYIREQSKKRGWDTRHVAAGGNFLEENEIVAQFPKIGLGQTKPDFICCIAGEPVVVIEAKNESDKISQALQEAIDYADLINKAGRYKIKMVVGAAGEEDTGFVVETRFLSPKGWTPLISGGQEITTVPSRAEAELALKANDGTTVVSVPAIHEFIDAAIEVSHILRAAKVEAPLRPKVIGAVVLAMYEGQIDISPANALRSVNELVRNAVAAAADLSAKNKKMLLDVLHLSGADFRRLAPHIGRVVAILRRLNIRVVLHTDTDFLGTFYEAFLRYGYDNNALGIVFTPRHITRFCVDLVGVSLKDRAIDIACGTGGFLVAAFDRMMAEAKGRKAIEKARSSIAGFDTNPTVWALSCLNMFFRGDGKSRIEHASCFEGKHRAAIEGKFTRAFLNPPFSQEDEPERDFIDASMEALEPGGLLAVVVKAGIFADDDHAKWRREFLRKHSIAAVISLPEDLFYPTAAPTSILVATAHEPQSDNASVLMARIWNDGYEKLKGRRVERAGSQLAEIKKCFDNARAGRSVKSQIARAIKGSLLRDGVEWSPQEWLSQPVVKPIELQVEQENVRRSVYQAVAGFPQLADAPLSDFAQRWSALPPLPLKTSGPITDFFEVDNGRSAGEKNYGEGDAAYVSSGDTTNSIVGLVAADGEEIFERGGVTVTAFGTASVQPWPFAARGNGGSAVRVLTPKFNMSVAELVWFASQINIQKWRFFYARMAIRSRITRLEVSSPDKRIPDRAGVSIAEQIENFRDMLYEVSRVV